MSPVHGASVSDRLHRAQGPRGSPGRLKPGGGGGAFQVVGLPPPIGDGDRAAEFLAEDQRGQRPPRRPWYLSLDPLVGGLGVDAFGAAQGVGGVVEATGERPSVTGSTCRNNPFGKMLRQMSGPSDRHGYEESPKSRSECLTLVLLRHFRHRPLYRALSASCP